MPSQPAVQNGTGLLHLAQRPVAARQLDDAALIGLPFAVDLEMRQRLLKLPRHGIGIGEQQPGDGVVRLELQNPLVVLFGLFERRGQQVAR